MDFTAKNHVKLFQLGKTPVQTAAAKSNSKILKILIAAGGNLNAHSFVCKIFNFKFYFEEIF